MPATAHPSGRASLRGFGLTLLLLNTSLIAAAAVYAVRHEIPASVAVPVAAAFLLQASVYLVPGFPSARARLEERFSEGQIASMAWASSVAPYWIYSIPTGVFSLVAAGKLALLCGLIAGLFLFVRHREEGLSLTDAVVLAALAYPMVSGLSTLFRDIYASPHPEIERLDALGKIMLVPLGAIVFLSIRKVSGTGFRFKLSRLDLKTGVKNYLLFLPIGVPLALATGFVRWSPAPMDHWTYAFVLVGNMLGIYLVIGLGEELYFRGLIQNLLGRRRISPWAAQLITSVLFGAAHLGRRGFPNWEYATVAAVAGWFHGRAYAARGSVPAAAVTHTLVVLTWRFLFG